jgi:ATP-dependent protease HslVU (ClpYQ) peptidase subunit
MIGDGQVSQGSMVVKGNATKVKHAAKHDLYDFDDA